MTNRQHLELRLVNILTGVYIYIYIWAPVKILIKKFSPQEKN